MKKARTKWAVLLLALLVVAFGALTVANAIQTDGGNVIVTQGVIDAYRGVNGEHHLGQMTYKLYTPKTATAEHKGRIYCRTNGQQRFLPPGESVTFHVETGILT